MTESQIENQHQSVQQRFERIGMNRMEMIVAQGAARVGARQIIKYHGAPSEALKTQLKAEAGMTPVTAADLASEDVIVRIITGKLFPNHGVNPEEGGAKVGFGEGINIVWHIDPLDGTRSFTREQGTSTVGIALYEKGRPLLTAVCRPFQRQLLVAEVGKGAYMFPLDEAMVVSGEGKKLQVSNTGSLNGGIVYFDGVMTEKTRQPTSEFIKKLTEHANKYDFRSLGTNIGQQAEVAMGHGDLSVTTAVGGFYDIACGSLLIKEAGGEFVDAAGEAISPATQVAAGGNKTIVAQVLPFLKDCFSEYGGFK